MKDEAWIGIDNGHHGAIVALTLRSVAIAYEMPLIHVKKTAYALDMKGLGKILRELCDRFDIRGAAIERAQAMPKQGVSSTFKIGQGYGATEMALVLLGIPYETVQPRRWVTDILSGVEGEGKERAIRYVQRQYPALDLTPGKKRTPHDGIADAACLATYARRQAVGVTPEDVNRMLGDARFRESEPRRPVPPPPPPPVWR